MASKRARAILRNLRMTFQATLFRFTASFTLVFAIALLLQQDCHAQANVATQATFRVKLDSSLKSGPVSGRLFVFFSKRALPMKGPNWFAPEPFFGKDVVDVSPGDEMTISNDVVGFPGTMDELQSGRWNVQAVLDHDLQYADHKNGPGNFYSDPVVIQFNKGVDNGQIPLTLNQVIRPKRIEDTQRFKLVQHKSKLLWRPTQPIRSSDILSTTKSAVSVAHSPTSKLSTV